MRDRLGESLGGRGRRHDLVGASGDDGYRDRDFAKALRGEDRPRPRRQGEDGADALITIRIVSLAVALPEVGIGTQARQALLTHLGSRWRRFARRAGGGRAAERLELCRIGDAAGDRDNGVAAERMTGGADPRRIDQAAERFVA